MLWNAKFGGSTAGGAIRNHLRHFFIWLIFESRKKNRCAALGVCKFVWLVAIPSTKLRKWIQMRVPKIDGHGNVISFEFIYLSLCCLSYDAEICGPINLLAWGQTSRVIIFALDISHPFKCVLRDFFLNWFYQFVHVS